MKGCVSYPDRRFPFCQVQLLLQAGKQSMSSAPRGLENGALLSFDSVVFFKQCHSQRLAQVESSRPTVDERLHVHQYPLA